jgi:two-component system NarL family sensor kinase
MFNTQAEIFHLIVIVSVFFILLIAIIIITALLYHSRKRIHKIEVSNFQNILIQSQYEVQEQTMQTIGADLHDNIGQLLSLTSLTLNSIELDDQAKARHKIDAAIDLTLRSIKEMRLLGKLLQGDQLVVGGLSEAIRHEISWMERSGKYQITYLQAETMPAENNPEKDLILFRIIQEILNNIIKHAAASQINISLDYTDGILQLKITDDGVGFNAADLPAEQRGMGLQNIQKRAGIIAGKAEITSNPGEGTQITIYIPYP